MDRMRCIDDFLINPTIASDHELPPSPIASPKPQFSSTSGSNGKAPIDDDMAFHFWPTYTSDEEATSPWDDDGASQYSVSSIASLPEVFGEASAHDVGPNCQQAQTVVIQSAGPAKMVSMPKVIDSVRKSVLIEDPGRGQVRPSIMIPQREASTAKSRHARSSTDSSSRNNSLSSAGPLSPASTAPSSVCDDAAEDKTTKQTKRISRHIDLMQAARAINPASPASPVLGRASTFGSLPATPTTPRRIKFSSSFALNRIGKTLVRRDSHVDNVESVNVTRNMVPPKRYSSGRPKLVARAADEIEPTIVLPPCPHEYKPNPYE